MTPQDYADKQWWFAVKFGSVCVVCLVCALVALGARAYGWLLYYVGMVVVSGRSCARSCREWEKWDGKEAWW